MLTMILDLWTVFSSGFLSSTLLPGNSEIVFYYYLKSSEASALLLIGSVSCGNILGAFINYLAGKGTGKGLKFFKKRKPNLIKYRTPIRFIRKYEKVSLLCSFLPWVGDPITYAAGILKVKLKTFLFWVSVGKVSRYSFLSLIESGL